MYDFNESTTTYFPIPAKSFWTYEATVSAMKNDYTQVASYKLIGAVKTDNSGNTTLVWSNNIDPIKILYADNTDWNASIVLSTNNIRVQAVGADSTTIKWTCKIEFTEVSF